MSGTTSFTQVGRCEISKTAQICSGAVIGKPFRPLLTNLHENEDPDPTRISAAAYIGYYALFGSGSSLGERSIVDDYCSVESDVHIGSGSLLIYRAQICNEARIGNGCVIGGLIAERVVVADGARVFGKVVHSQHNPRIGWDDSGVSEPSAIIEQGAFIGFDAMVIGGVRIGKGAFICSGAIVTRDVPDFHIARGVNGIVLPNAWSGPLGQSDFFNHG